MSRVVGWQGWGPRWRRWIGRVSKGQSALLKVGDVVCVLEIRGVFEGHENSLIEKLVVNGNTILVRHQHLGELWRAK